MEVFNMSGAGHPYISVIIVAYNYADFLPRALAACKRQTYQNFELVVVNNGSTDSTQSVIEKFISDNPHMKIKSIFIEKNEGLPKGRNTGIAHAEGDYLLFNDADDWMDDNCLEILAAASENGYYDRICAQYRDVAPDGNVLQIRNYQKNVSKWFITMIQASLFKRSIFIDNNIIVPDVFSDDYYISITTNAYSEQFKVVCETVYNYYINELSTSGAKSVKEPDRILKMVVDGIEMTLSLKNTISNEDYMLLEYQLIKFYYFHLLHYNRYNKFTNIWNLYKQLHAEMLRYNLIYLKNKNIVLFKDNGDRFYGRCITFLLSKFETTKTIKLFLKIYLIISKFHFFKV